MVEYFWLVDENDKPLGKIERNECHQKSMLHRSTAVFVFNKKGQLWINKRSTKKKIFGGCIDCSVSAHVEYGESYEHAAQREMEEEICVMDHVRFMYMVRMNDKIDNMHIAIFSVETNTAPQIDKEEIEYGEFMNIEKVKETVAKNPATLWFKLALDKYYLLNKKKIKL